MKNKQTAVEFLESQFNENGKLTPVDFYQAKAMEKEQIEDAFETKKSRLIYKNDCGQILLRYIDGDEYYNETYGK